MYILCCAVLSCIQHTCRHDTRTISLLLCSYKHTDTNNTRCMYHANEIGINFIRHSNVILLKLNAVAILNNVLLLLLHEQSYICV